MSTHILIALASLVAAFVSTTHAQTTIFEFAQKKALELYPDLGVVGSPFHTAFMSKLAEWRTTNPYYTADPEWPLKLAKSLCPEPITIRYVIKQALANGAIVITTLPGQLGTIYIDGLPGLDGDSGTVRAYPRGYAGFETVGAGYRKMHAYTTSCSKALKQ